MYVHSDLKLLPEKSQTKLMHPYIMKGKRKRNLFLGKQMCNQGVKYLML